MRARCLLLAAIVVSSAACRSPNRRNRVATLGPGDVASAGGVVLSANLVAAVARARRVSSRDALDDVVHDALLAEGARDRGLERDPAVRWAIAADLARRMATQIQDDARALGPPTDDELANVTVVHAVVLRSTILTDEQALAIATAIADAVKSATNADDFTRRASAVAHPSARVIVERVADFGADGVLADGGHLETKFVTAAFALHSRLETSPVVQTSFGWHVLRLVERKTPDDDLLRRRRGELADAVDALRAHGRQDAIVRARAAREHVEVMGAAESLMASARSGGE